MSSLAEAALRLAERGRPVFPCSPRGKTPLTPNGLYDATAAPGVVKARWARWPEANVAMPTGAASGFVALDVDPDGHESLRSLEAEHGRLPVTWSSKTPRGGAHYLFRHPGQPVRNSAGRLGPGLDFRGDGGYIVVPPSIGANGRRYEVDEETSAAHLPGWLHDRVREPATGERAAVPVAEWVAMVRDGIPEGKRNANLTRLVGHLLARDVDARLVAELARLVNARGRPPLEPREVDRIVTSIAGREVRRRRSGTR